MVAAALIAGPIIDVQLEPPEPPERPFKLYELIFLTIFIEITTNKNMVKKNKKEHIISNIVINI